MNLGTLTETKNKKEDEIPMAKKINLVGEDKITEYKSAIYEFST